MYWVDEAIVVELFMGEYRRHIFSKLWGSLVTRRDTEGSILFLT